MYKQKADQHITVYKQKADQHITVYKQKPCIETKVLNMQVWKSGGDVAEYVRQTAVSLS